MWAKAALLLSLGLPCALALKTKTSPADPKWVVRDPKECKFITRGKFHCDARRRCGFTRPPTLCPQGKDQWSLEQLRAALPKFAEVYAGRPPYFRVNSNGMDVSHAFSLWFAVRSVRPRWIIESGAYRGFGTWLLRQAAPGAHIVSIDPQHTPLWKERSPNMTYLTGEDFVDFGKADWASMIPAESRNSTFIVLDDHMDAVRRMREALAAGLFGHIFLDDNEQDRMYSFNKVCAPHTQGEKPLNIAQEKDGVELWDNFNQFVRVLSPSEHQENVDFVNRHAEVYFEFPAVIGRCYTAAQRGSALVESDKELVALGLPLVADELFEYSHNFPPYIKLRA